MVSFNPKLSSFSSEESMRKLQENMNEKKRLKEEKIVADRKSLAKNIILPKIAQFQFDEYVSIGDMGNVSYNKTYPEELFEKGWETFRATLPNPIMIKRELKNCKIGVAEYELFLKNAFDSMLSEGLIEEHVSKDEINLERCGSVYQPRPNIWVETDSGKEVPTNIKIKERKSYSLKEGTDWHNLLKKALSHENPIGISMNQLSIGYDSLRESFPQTLSRPSYEDFESLLEKVGKFDQRKVDKREKVEPDLALRLIRLHSSLSDLYRNATRSVAMPYGPRERVITLGPVKVLRRLLEYLPSGIGKISYDASDLSRTYGLDWARDLENTANTINSNEGRLRKKSSDLLMKGIGSDDDFKKEIRDIIFQTVPFASNARNEMERTLGYGKKSYVLL